LRYLIGTLPAGIFFPAFFPRLPGLWWIWLCLFIALILLVVRRGRSYCAFFLLGMAWGCLWGQWHLGHQLPVVQDKIDVYVTGTVVSLPRESARKTAFRLRVESVDGAQEPLPPLRQLQLSWYSPQARPKAGERWRLNVRLRSPRGFANPGTFDYQGWLFAEGVSATGYVRAGDNRQLSAPRVFSLHRIRQLLLDRVTAAGNDTANGYLAALILGETSLISAERFRRLVTTGTVHLMVVSGLHIGMIAAIGFWFGGLMGRALAVAGSRVAAPVIAAWCALTLAAAYCLLAGFGLPAQRALVMTGVVVVAVVARRRVGPAAVLGWALCAIALVDPLAVTRMGFWMSFSAVAGLVLFFAPRKRMGKIKGLLYAQPVVMVALLPCMLYYQGQVSPWMLPINLVVIPWISSMVVPLALLGAALQAVTDHDLWFWRMARWQLEKFDYLLTWFNSNVGPDMGLLSIQTGSCSLLFATVLVSIGLLMPAGLGLRMVSLVLGVAVLLFQPARPPLALTVLDVGQGTAVVVRADDQTLVYDAGPAFSEAFDAGSAVVAPYLRSLGVRRVNMLVVSHDDNDHSGGAAGLLRAIPVDEVLGNVQKSGLLSASGANVSVCRAGQRWQWHGVDFEMLSPDRRYNNDNNNSCVLRISAPQATIVLPGDIEKHVERELVKHYELEGVDVLLAPHHGSKTSSSLPFVAETRPRHVVFSAGFNHHFGHPHPEVAARYSPHSTVWNTAASGALEFVWSEQGHLEVTAYRRQYRRYWHRAGPRQHGPFLAGSQR
jgi:competence protein ComEC